MKRLIFILFSFLFLGSFKLKAQVLPIKEDCVLFRDAKTNQTLLIVEDSVLYKGEHLTKQVFKHTPYPSKLIHYVNFNIKDKTYLVQHGCGPVLEYRKDSLVRIDRSFLHQNQYSAVKFVFKDEIYFFGGYGLFTYKNILTKFDFKTKEWNSIQTFGDEVPSPRSGASGILINDDLYVFAGIEANELDFYGNKKCNNVLWKLHLPDKVWSKVGQFNEQFVFSDLLSFYTNEKLYLINPHSSGVILEIDILKNTIKKFQTKPILEFIEMNYDLKNREITFVHNQISNHTSQYINIKLDNFIGKAISVEQFYYPISTTSKSFWFLPILLLPIMWFYRKKITIIFTPFNGIVFNKSNQTYSYKGRLITSFEDTERRILDYLMENSSRFISLNELNKLFENGEIIESFSTTIKRRENSVIGLFLKLALITGVPENNFLISRKNSEDKRIKEVKLREGFVKIK
ncbi:MAG: Kelch repeat-containing protein [Flavobacterium sp.]